MVFFIGGLIMSEIRVNTIAEHFQLGTHRVGLSKVSPATYHYFAIFI